MSWSKEQQDRVDEINALPLGELVHLMIREFDGDRESSGPWTQSQDYFRAAEELDRRGNLIGGGK